MKVSDLDHLKKVNSVHLLRGITIFIIVTCHCYGKFHITDIPNTINIGKSYFFFFSELTFNWTVAFVLISGFLFQHLSDRYQMKKYFLSKFKNVILPYTFVTLILFLIIYRNNLSLSNLGIETEHFLDVWFKGSISWPLWYIPMITVIFIFSPLFFYLSKRNLLVLCILSFILITMSPRPANNLDLIATFCYFAPVYIIGMAIRQYYVKLMTLVNKNVFSILIFTFFILIFTLAIYQIKNGFHASSTIIVTPTRILFFILILYFLDFVNRKDIRGKVYSFFSYLANISFPIFFIHDFIAHHLFFNVIYPNNIFKELVYNQSGYFLLFIGLIYTLIVLFLSIITVELVKRIAGNKSRYFIGG